MFTGIVEEIGTVTGVWKEREYVRLRIASRAVSSGVGEGDSVAVNGICLTVTETSRAVSFSCDAVAETLGRTTLPEWRTGRRVNLERAVTLSSPLGGHLVQGHVDGVARLLKREVRAGGTDLCFSLDGAWARYLVAKGSVCLDGVSLTVAELGAEWFRVALVPHTLAHTTLGDAGEGDAVNVETDVIARYVERLLACGLPPAAGGGERITNAFLRAKGFGRKE